MNFKQLPIKKSYINQGTDNLVDGLLNPGLKLSVKYRRSVGFFSSSVFRLLLNSLPSFIQNRGVIQLIVSPSLSQDDINAIQLGYEKKSDLVSRRFLEDFNSEIRCFDDTSLNVLSELVARGILDIKVASVKNDIGIYHDKLGILTDKDGNHIVFYGSANSSVNAYQNNYEKVRVVRSWIAGEGDSVEDEILEFDRLWNDQNEFLDTYDFMESVKKSILVVIEERKQAKSQTEPITLYERLLKSKSITELSTRAIGTYTLLEEKLIRRQGILLQEEFIKCFRAIINKENFVDGIVIDRNINVIPYKFIDVTFLQIENYMRMNEQTKFLSLFDSSYLNEINKLRLGQVETIRMPSPITAPFSQGERQVYIMSIYLALLKTSRKDIPFFIDTPFARIDSNHREKIVKEFFSVISNQMFILSTDEEIVGEYKALIDENISNEFMLSITNYGKTRVIPNSYFEV